LQSQEIIYMIKMKQILLSAFSIIHFWAFAQDYSCKSRKTHSHQEANRRQAAATLPFDVFLYEINIDATAFTNVLVADAGIHFRVDSALSSISFQLIQLQVDSVRTGHGNALTFTHNGGVLSIQIGSMAPSDTGFVRVFYRGVAATDASGWGGVYYAGGIFYNLGVGFAANPHGYGRAWHPCNEDFRERAAYRLNVHTQSQHRAQCIGQLDSVVTTSAGLRYHWSMDEEIPAYLASFAVGPYEVVNQTHQGLLGNIPIELAAKAADTTNVKNSFVNLGGAIDAFESAFGPYVWDKVGFVMTGQGAMEHPTNVAYPISIANGTLTYQDIIAHELAHHWWGDLATCETEEDMWINEGIAEWSSHYFFEHVYNRAEYMSRVLTNHYNVLRTAHIQDNGFRPLANMPHAYTYGTHVYNKGASTFHSLRGYFNNDALFFSSLQQLLTNFSFKSISTIQFRDSLTSISGIDLSHFWNNWIYEPGFAQVSVDSFSVLPSGGLFEVTLHLHQRLRATNQYYTQMPIEIRMTEASGNDVSLFTNVNGEFTTATLLSPILPQWIVVNPEGLLNLGTTYFEEVRSTTGTFGNGQVGMITTIQSITDSIRIRIEHHWAKPNEAPHTGVRFSSSHYWSVSGIDLNKATITANILFDKRASNALLDEDLVSITEDSLALFYRPNAGSPWVHYPHYVKNVQSNSSNGWGRMELSQLLPGDYIFGNADPTIGLDEHAEMSIELFPNPASESLTIKGLSSASRIEIVDYQGRSKYKATASNESLRLDISNWKVGAYLIITNQGVERFEVVR